MLNINVFHIGLITSLTTRTVTVYSKSIKVAQHFEKFETTALNTIYCRSY